jgi:NAD(P)-dependent dehydrogenase (short-subunit alcohol dehydrogenase family)
MSKLQRKTALTTGASKGIGAGIAKDLAVAGAAVVVNYATDRSGAGSGERNHEGRRKSDRCPGRRVQANRRGSAVDKLKVACVIGQWRDKEWVGKARPIGFSPKDADVVIEFKRGCAVNQRGGIAMPIQLPELAAGYVRTTNGNDPTGFIALFAEDAVIDDAGRIIRGCEAIRTWAASDIFAANVTLDVFDVSGDNSDATITAKVDGTFDRTGLPDPLIMTLHIAAFDGKITKLTCRLAEK